MKIILNGKEKEVKDSCSISDLLESIDRHPQKVAVEINREIIKRDQYSQVKLNEGDEIEILQFVGGGSLNHSGE